MTTTDTRTSRTSTAGIDADTLTTHQPEPLERLEPELQPINPTRWTEHETNQPGGRSDTRSTSAVGVARDSYTGSMAREDSVRSACALTAREESVRRRARLLEVVDVFARVHGEAKVSGVRAEVHARGSLSTHRVIVLLNQLMKGCTNGYKS